MMWIKRRKRRKIRYRTKDDAILRALKQPYQEACREMVRKGLRSPQSMHFIRPELVRAAVIKFPDVDWE